MSPTLESNIFTEVKSIIDSLRKHFRNDWYEAGTRFVELLTELRQEGQYVELAESLAAAVAYIPVGDPAASVIAVTGWLRQQFPDVVAALDSDELSAFVEGIESAI